MAQHYQFQISHFHVATAFHAFILTFISLSLQNLNNYINLSSNSVLINILLIFIFNISLTQNTMSRSSSKNNNRDTVGEGETLFDFLKRKKKIALESTVNKSLAQHSHTKKKIDFDLDDDYPHEQSKSKNTYQHHSNKEVSRGFKQTFTPTKIDFQEHRQVKNTREYRQPTPTKVVGGVNSQAKTFLALISPLKNRPQSRNQDHRDNNKYQKQNLESFNYNNTYTSNARSSLKKGDVFAKKRVTTCINSLKEKFNYYSNHIVSLKDKVHGLGVLFNPILNHLLQTQNPYTKQVGDLKNKLKSFESLINSIDIDSNDVIQDFHRELQEHIQFQQGSLKKSYENVKKQQIQAYKSQQELILNNLQAQHKKILRENELLTKKLEKFIRSKEQIQQNVQEREINHIQTVQRLRQNYQGTITQLREEIGELKGQLTEVNEVVRQKDREIKNERISKEAIEEKTRKEIQQIIEVKDAYLLNEIMVLKTEFNADIMKISEFSRIKEAQLLDKLAKKEQQMSKIQFEKGCDKHIQTRIVQQANLIKRQNLELKSKADCLITDMYRMNEELYQHWVALKDIKSLGTRLGAFGQYKKIYDDLLFNDNLFH